MRVFHLVVSLTRRLDFDATDGDEFLERELGFGFVGLDVERGEDAVGLGVALEPVGQAELGAGQTVEGRLAEVTEGRVAEVVGVRRRLDDGLRL